MKKNQISLYFAFIFVSFIVATKSVKSVPYVEDSVENIIKSFNLQNDVKLTEKDVTPKDGKDCGCGEYGTKCYFEDGIHKCECIKGYGRKIISQTRQTCVECNCGTNGISCLIGSNIKLCTCQLGNYTAYLVRDKCKECDCGPNNVSCEFDDEGNRLCKCGNGYVSEKVSKISKDEYCNPCDCGKNGTCEVKNGRKVCSCVFGFTELDGKCVECDCGGEDAAYNCTREAVTLFRRCNCKEGYARVKRDEFLENETCERCDCGEFAVSCEFFLYQDRACTCKEGYVRSDEFGKNDYCEKYTVFTGWTIAVLIIALVGAAGTTAAIIFRMKRSAANR